MLSEMLDLHGVIAQLGERLPCTQEVCGSIPHSSTNFHCYLEEVSQLIFFFFWTL
jgi:hypothetical protein